MRRDVYRKYLDLISSMTVEALIGGITQETYVANMRGIMRRFDEDESDERQQPTTPEGGKGL